MPPAQWVDAGAAAIPAQQNLVLDNLVLENLVLDNLVLENLVLDEQASATAAQAAQAHPIPEQGWGASLVPAYSFRCLILQCLLIVGLAPWGRADRNVSAVQQFHRAPRRILLRMLLGRALAPSQRLSRVAFQ